MRPYFMGYKAAVPTSRMEAFLASDMDPNEVVIFIQDLIEADLIPVLSDRFYEYAIHYVDLGWCHTTAKLTH